MILVVIQTMRAHEVAQPARVDKAELDRMALVADGLARIMMQSGGLERSYVADRTPERKVLTLSVLNSTNMQLE